MKTRKVVQRLRVDPGLPFRRLSREVLRVLRLRPSSEPFISGDTFRAFSDKVFDETHKVEAKNVLPGDIIFCNGDLISEFFTSVVPKLTTPTVVILGNSDRNYGSNDVLLFGSGMGHSFFVQNLITKIPNCEAIPIGLENRHWQNVGRPRDFAREWSRQRHRKNRIFWTFLVRTNKPVRKAAELALRSNLLADYIGEVSPRSHRQALLNYRFVAAPPGNGWDTHRTWEALYLGCVPICLDSFFARSFVERGLPIWIVSSYSDLNGLTEEDLEAKYLEFLPRFDSPLLTFDYWSQRIRAVSGLLSEA